MRVLKTPEPDEMEQAVPQRDAERLGDVLREHREALGHSIADVAAYIRIRPVYLESIEQGRYADLPGRTYAIGFVRGYAEFVGLDGEEAVRRFRAEAAGMDTSTQLVFPSPPPEGKVPGGAIMFVAALLVAVVYGAWYYLSSQDQKLADLVPALPGRFAALIGGAPAAGTGDGVPATTTTRAEPAASAPTPVTTAPTASAPIVPPAASTPATPAAPSRSETARAEAARSEATRTETARTEVPARPAPLQATSSAVAPASVAPTPAAPPSPPPAAPAITANPVIPPSVTIAPPVGGAMISEATAAPRRGATEPPAGAATSTSAATTSVTATTAPITTLGGAAADQVGPSTMQLASAPPDSGGARIVIRATGESWVQVRDSERVPVMTRILRAGDTYQVPNRAGLTLYTGNAGALELFVDGHATPQLGRLGAVMRDVALDPDRLRAGTAAAAPAANQ